MTVTTSPGTLGQISRSVTWTPEEYEFVETHYPREGFHERVFLEIIVEQFQPSGEELIYGWMGLMKLVKDGPDSFDKLEVKPIPPQQS